jgi:hypothetical protein
VLDPEQRAADRQLGDFDAAAVALEAIELGRAERSGVEGDRLLRIAYRKPGGDIWDGWGAQL